jgi:hypothetical protein
MGVAVCKERTFWRCLGDAGSLRELLNPVATERDIDIAMTVSRTAALVMSRSQRSAQ